VLKALEEREKLLVQQHDIGSNLSSLENKLNVLKKRMSEVELALKLTGEGANEYTLSNRTLASPTRNEILLTIKTNASEGLLLNMLGENVNLQVTYRNKHQSFQ
jgi:hypothetical protein